MNPFRCTITAISTQSPLEGSITIERDAAQLTVPIRPLSVYSRWVRDWKVGDEVICRVHENQACGLINGTSHIDPLPVPHDTYESLLKWAESGPDSPEFHLGDIVEEIATKRRGKIDNISSETGADGQKKINYWRVYFMDNKKPLFGIIKEVAEIRLVSCPHTASEPRFYPERPIMG